jgi:hypothetical protein
VLQQLTIVLGKHATERAWNGELVWRLQQLHAEKVDVLELQRQYLELQEAHFQQVRVFGAIGGKSVKIGFIDSMCCAAAIAAACQKRGCDSNAAAILGATAVATCRWHNCSRRVGGSHLLHGSPSG